jgi:hypothetical protein
MARVVAQEWRAKGAVRHNRRLKAPPIMAQPTAPRSKWRAIWRGLWRSYGDAHEEGDVSAALATEPESRGLQHPSCSRSIRDVMSPMEVTMVSTGRPRGYHITDAARGRLSASMRRVWSDPARKRRIILLRELTTGLTGELKETYRFYRIKGFSAAEALRMLGMLKGLK